MLGMTVTGAFVVAIVAVTLECERVAATCVLLVLLACGVF